LIINVSAFHTPYIRILFYMINITNLQYSLNIKPYDHIKPLLSKLKLLKILLALTFGPLVCYFASYVTMQ
jgi:hypothetical protein